MKRKILTTMNGRKYEQLVPENAEDQAILDEMARGGEIETEDLLHRIPPADQVKPKKPRKVA